MNDFAEENKLPFVAAVAAAAGTTADARRATIVGDADTGRARPGTGPDGTAPEHPEASNSSAGTSEAAADDPSLPHRPFDEMRTTHRRFLLRRSER